MLIFLVCLELGLRLLFPIPEIKNFDRANYIPGSESSSYSFYGKSKWYWQSDLDTSYRFVHHLNAYGFRDKEWKVAKAAGKKRVAFIGDSFTEGIMTDVEHNLVAAFNKMDTENQYETMNFGIMGIGLTSYARLINDVCLSFDPDAIIINLYANDISNDESLIRSNYQPEQQPFSWRTMDLFSKMVRQENLSLRGSNDLSAFLPDSSDANFPFKSRLQRSLTHVNAELHPTYLEGKINPFKINQLKKEEIGLSKVAEMRWFFAYLSEIKSQYQCDIYLSYIPSRHQVTDYYLPYDKSFCLKLCRDISTLTSPNYNIHQPYLNALSKRHNIPFLDLTKAIKTKEQNGEHLYWNYDEHMNRKGYAFIGQQIFECVNRFNR